MMIFILTKYNIFVYSGGTRTRSGLSAPVSSGFFVPSIGNNLPIWRVDRGQYNTRKGNNPSRLLAIVETRRLSKAAKLNQKEAQMKEKNSPDVGVPDNKTMRVIISLNPIWDTRNQLNCLSGIALLLAYLLSDLCLKEDHDFSIFHDVFSDINDRLNQSVESLNSAIDGMKVLEEAKP